MAGRLILYLLFRGVFNNFPGPLLHKHPEIAIIGDPVGPLQHQSGRFAGLPVIDKFRHCIAGVGIEEEQIECGVTGSVNIGPG